MVEKEEEDSMLSVVFSKEDRVYLEVLRRKQKEEEARDGVSTSSSFKGNVAYSVATTQGTCDSLVLASFPTAGSSEWIINFGESGHVTCTAREFSSYTRLAVSLSVKTADGMDQPVVSKGTVKYTNTLTLSKVLHAPFPINLLSINAIVLQLNCIVLFDISKVIFREKKTGGILRTGTWRSSLWYMDREGIDSALSSIVERSGGNKISVEDLLLLHHKHLGHPSFSLLSRLYPRLFEKTNENNFFVMLVS
jgi:hypothetical protein